MKLDLFNKVSRSLKVFKTFRPFNRLPLREQLLSSFLLVILTSISLIALVVSQFAPVRLEEIGLLASQRRAFRLAAFFADYYRQAGSWDGMARLVGHFNEPLPPELIDKILADYPGRARIVEAAAHDRLVLSGTDGRVIGDSDGLLRPGQPLPADLAIYAVPIQGPAGPIGQLLVTSELEQAISTFVLTALRRTLFGAALAAAGLAVLVSLWLAHHLTKPVRMLNLTARRLAAGDSTAPLPVESKDEIGQLMQTFNDMAAAISQQKQLRRQMMADIAHELRTPLSIMQLDIEGLSDGLQSPDKAAASLREEIQALNRLIEDLRLLSLVEAGGLQFDLVLLNPADLLRRVVGSWQAQAQERQIELATQIAADLPPIYADEGRLAQVFNNLLSNTLRYTPTGKSIKVGGRPETAEIVLWVADSGPGIAADHLPYIFERFYQVDSSRRREIGGSGLGLAIAKQWVSLHGGRIWAESKLGVGTTFYIALPVTNEIAET